jgi:hypothetical protein
MAASGLVRKSLTLSKERTREDWSLASRRWVSTAGRCIILSKVAQPTIVEPRRKPRQRMRAQAHHPLHRHQHQQQHQQPWHAFLIPA